MRIVVTREQRVPRVPRRLPPGRQSPRRCQLRPGPPADRLLASTTVWEPTWATSTTCGRPCGTSTSSSTSGGVEDVDLATDHPEVATRANVVGTTNVGVAAGEVGASVIYASTWEVYGTPRADPVDETHPCEPDHAYGATKLAGQRECSGRGPPHPGAAHSCPSCAWARPTATACGPDSVFSRFGDAARSGEPLVVPREQEPVAPVSPTPRTSPGRCRIGRQAARSGTGGTRAPYVTVNVGGGGARDHPSAGRVGGRPATGCPSRSALSARATRRRRRWRRNGAACGARVEGGDAVRRRSGGPPRRRRRPSGPPAPPHRGDPVASHLHRRGPQEPLTDPAPGQEAATASGCRPCSPWWAPWPWPCPLPRRRPWPRVAPPRFGDLSRSHPQHRPRPGGHVAVSPDARDPFAATVTERGPLVIWPPGYPVLLAASW